MSTIRAQGRFHIVYTLKYIRYGLILCLVPIVQALFSWDFNSLYTAFHQDAIILSVMGIFSLCIWNRVGFTLTEHTLALRYGLLFPKQTTIRASEVAALVLDRPFFLRLLGCTRIKLYATSSKSFGKAQFYLSRRHAAVLAECILPVQTESSFFAPSGTERIRFTMLSANLITTSALVYISAQQTEKILGRDIVNELNQLAVTNLEKIEQLAELFLPAGVAWLFTILFLLWGIALFFSLLSTSNFRVSRSGGVILSKGGFINHSERRILASAVSYCDIRITPISRILRRYPVFLCAGSYLSDSPILVYRKGYEALLQALMPQFIAPRPIAIINADRSWPQFLWKSSSLFLLCSALTAVSVWRLPDLTLLLFIPQILSFALILVSIEGWFTEGICSNPNRTLSVCYTRFFTKHNLCIFTNDISFSTLQTPFSENIARCNFTLHLPCGKRILIRSIKSYQAHRLKLIR